MAVSSRTAARHRRPVRTRTPLAVIGDAVSTSGSSVGRRSAVIAASGGLIVTMGLPAVASPMLSGASAGEAGASHTSSAPAAPVVAASSQAKVSFALTSLTTVDAAQYQHDSQVAAGERAAVQERASRASQRYEVAQKTAGTTTRVVRADDSDTDDDGDGSSTDASGSGASSGSTGSTGSTATTGSASTSATSAAVVDVAKRYVGIKYRYGGTTPAGFDCSGFVRYVYGQLGVDLPRTASQQAASGTRVSASDAKVGDIVSFTGKNGIFHNGIYLGGGKMIDSPRTGKAIDVHDIWSSSVVFTRVA